MALGNVVHSQLHSDHNVDIYVDMLMQACYHIIQRLGICNYFIYNLISVNLFENNMLLSIRADTVWLSTRQIIIKDAVQSDLRMCTKEPSFYLQTVYLGFYFILCSCKAWSLCLDNLLYRTSAFFKDSSVVGQNSQRACFSCPPHRIVCDRRRCEPSTSGTS
jgi:hypothetical protein